MTGMPAAVRVLISLFSPSGAVRPTTARTFRAIRYWAHAWAELASYFESHQTYSTWRPLMPPAWLIACMYARTVSRSTDESTGPVISKKPPMVILPPLTPPDPPPALEPPDPGGLGIAAGLAPDWAPDTSPCCTIAVVAGWVK